MSTESLLIELRTEELPPKALNNLGESFTASIIEQLQKDHFIAENTEYKVFASPRRLGVLVKNVASMQADQQVVKKGPSVANGMKDGEPTKALMGFARGAGAEVADLKVIHDGKQDVYAYEYTQSGQSLESVMADVLAQAVKKLPIPKVMRWGSSTHTFVRPVHGLVVMLGKTVLNTEVLGLTSQNWTLGHRFMATEPVVFAEASEYESKMAEKGKVIASFAARRALIDEHLAQAAGKLNATVAADEALRDEVTALVELPVVLEAGFEAHFLNVPQECLILTMQQNQKYFPLLDANGKLMNRFLLVSNIKAQDPVHVITGNERVLRARLSDAEFFYQTDLKKPLESRLPRLQNVVYHNKLGSQSERIARLVAIAGKVASKIGADLAQTERATLLAKADLVTEMVGEFPELQGTMGKYYAQHDGETAVVAQALEQHYQPRFAGDDLPETTVATSVALADKLEAIVGIWGIGLIPTGDKDPYALRRAALGVVRMLMQYPVSLPALVQDAFDSFPVGKLAANTVAEVTDFMYARLAVLLQGDYAQDVVAAVLAHRPDSLHDLTARLEAVSEFKALPEAAALAAANKRVHNLLKKTDGELGAVNPVLLQEDAEKALYAATEGLQAAIASAMSEQNFKAALSQLATLRAPVDAFFDGVMVMADDAALKQNRLNLLHQLNLQLNAVADIALLND
ncbi:MAG: glycine--tRNA ligase subunit beta [Vitreoscilla sp.]|nr:glycine--tRNA ligase subunit beta [Vitreoscilla sp.]